MWPVTPSNFSPILSELQVSTSPGLYSWRLKAVADFPHLLVYRLAENQVVAFALSWEKQRLYLKASVVRSTCVMVAELARLSVEIAGLVYPVFIAKLLSQALLEWASPWEAGLPAVSPPRR